MHPVEYYKSATLIIRHLMLTICSKEVAFTFKIYIHLPKHPVPCFTQRGPLCCWSHPNLRPPSPALRWTQVLWLKHSWWLSLNETVNGITVIHKWDM
jgi:hypothetical protein